MSLINVQNLTFSYDGSCDVVFENVNFQIDTDWKLGFVGRNGRGKTTFLKLLMGKYAYGGKISADVNFTYFPFEVSDKNKSTLEIMEEICPCAQDWELIRELSYLQVEPEILYSDYASLSGGEQTKVLLAGLFLGDNNFLLIDEPTNHLDSDARRAVSSYLKRKKGFIIVSHDREFLDGCVDHILSINKSDIDVQSGNFSSWLENFQRVQAYESAQNDKLKKEIARLAESSRQTSSWADKVEASKYGNGPVDRGYIGHKSAKMMKRAKVTQARREDAIEKKESLLRNAETVGQLKFEPLAFRRETLVEFSDVSVFYGDRKVCDRVSFQIKNGDRIAVEGKNGCGKSSVLKIIAGEDIKYSGNVVISSGVIVSYVSQSAITFDGSLSDFIEKEKIDGFLFRAILSKMGFVEKDFDRNKKISEYSEGQKKKVAIAKSLCEKAHLYVWDEPLNYLDVYSRMQIEELIKEYCPTMIFVEHDDAFRNAISTDQITPALNK